MLSLVEFAEFLTNRLNEIGATQDEKYEFNIYAEVGEAKAGVINGALRTDFPQTTPVADLVNVKYDLRVEFAVPSGLANFNVKNIEEIINLFIKAENGVEKTFSSGKGLITATLSRVKDFKVEPKVGTMLPLEFVIRVNYTEDVITSGSKHWFLNDLEIPFLNESVIVEKNGVTKNISGQNYKETFLTEKLKLYRFRFPFDTKNALCSMLQKDLLESGANKTYTLRYYDGVSFLNEEGKDFKTTVSIYRTNDTSSVKPETAMFDITFTDVKLKSNVKYFMGLIDNPFDGQTEDTMYFESLEEQQEWFNEMVANGCKYEEIPVPNLDSIDVTNQIYNFDTELYNVFDVTKKNYAIIKVVIEKENSEDVEYYFYYNITNPQIGTENQVSFSMQLDSLQTYYFIDEIKFEGSFIQKTLLNRWKQVDENTIEFNGDVDSKLFEREEIKNVAKRLVNRQKLVFDNEEIDVRMGQLLKQNVWVYVFLDGTDVESGEIKKYKFYRLKGFNETTSEAVNVSLPLMKSGNIETATACIAFSLEEILIGAYYLTETSSFGCRSSINAFNFLVLNNPTIKNNIKSIKISIKPPINFNEKILTGNLTTYNSISEDYRVRFLYENEGNQEGINPTAEVKVLTASADANSRAFLFSIEKDNLTPFQMKLQDDSFLPEFIYEKSQEKLLLVKKEKLNPKLNSLDYKSLSINVVGSQFDFDIQKLNTKKPKFEYLEPLTVDITKCLVRFVGKENGVFNEYYSKSFNGLIVSNDLSLPLSTSAYNEYLANNKNAYLSFQTQQTYNRDIQNISQIQSGVNWAINTVGGVANYMSDPKASLGGVISNTVQSASNIIFSEMNFQKGQALRQTQFDLSMDNMRNAPNHLINANGSALFANMVDKYGIYVELFEGLDHELEIANDIMARDGFTYNQFDDVKKYDKVRKFFNYIKANIGTITGIPISNQARADLRNRFANGVRFWNKNEEGKFVVDYSKENYEKWIETAYSSFEEWLENQ